MGWHGLGRGHEGRRGRGMFGMGRGGNWGGFGPEGPFGPHGPFGPDGPFGPEGPFGRDGPFGRHGSHGRAGGRRGRMFGSGELRLVLLKLIADEPRHGYDLIKAIEELTHGVYAPSPGVIYPTLTLLQDMGAIEEQGDGGTRKKFAVTQAGRDELEQRAEDVAGLMARLEETGGERRQQGGSPVWRAMRNLGVAIRNRVATGDTSSETVHDIAALIDELAQKIERLK